MFVEPDGSFLAVEEFNCRVLASRINVSFYQGLNSSVLKHLRAVDSSILSELNDREPI
jgi:hypothetical protein